MMQSMQPFQAKPAEISGRMSNGSPVANAEALLLAAGKCLAEFKLPTFEHLNQEDIISSAARVAIQDRDLDAFGKLQKIVSDNSGGRVRLVEADPDEFRFRVMSFALYLKLERGRESQLVRFTGTAEPFQMDSGQ